MQKLLLGMKVQNYRHSSPLKIKLNLKIIMTCFISANAQILTVRKNMYEKPIEELPNT